MKKIKIIITLIIICFCMNIVRVDAKTCTGINYAPPMPEVYGRMNTKVYKLTTASTQCKGSNTEVWFDDMTQWLDGDNAIYVDLYEDDPKEYEPDELVKKYLLHYAYDGYIADILIENITLGNIDSAGDQTCELYLSMYSSGTPNNTTPDRLFTYQICMK